MARRKKIDYAELEGPSPGTLPKKGADMLRAVFRGAVEQYYGREGRPLDEAEEIAARVAWTEVKRHYYKDRKTKKWKKRKTPLSRDEYPPGSAPYREPRAANAVEFVNDESADFGNYVRSKHDVALANGQVGALWVVESPNEPNVFWVVFARREGGDMFLLDMADTNARAKAIVRKVDTHGYVPLTWERARDRKNWLTTDPVVYALTCDGLDAGSFLIAREGEDPVYAVSFIYDAGTYGDGFLSVYHVGDFATLDDAKMAANRTRTYPRIIRAVLEEEGEARVANPCFGLHVHDDAVIPVLERISGGAYVASQYADPMMYCDLSKPEIHDHIARASNSARVANQATEVLYAKQIVDAANQYSAALRAELSAYDSGSSRDMEEAQLQSGAARRRLRQLIGAQRQLYGGMFGGAGGAAAGAALGTLVLGPVAGAAMGSIAGSVIGSYLLRPRSLPEEARTDASFGSAGGAFARPPSGSLRGRTANPPVPVGHYEVYVVTPDGVFLVGDDHDAPLSFGDPVACIDYCVTAQHAMDGEGNPELARHDMVYVTDDGTQVDEIMVFSTAPDGYSKKGIRDRERGRGRDLEDTNVVAMVFRDRAELELAATAMDVAMEAERMTLGYMEMGEYGVASHDVRAIAAELGAPSIETVLFLVGGKSELRLAKATVEDVIGSSKGKKKAFDMVDLGRIANGRRANGRHANGSPAFAATTALLLSAVGGLLGTFLGALPGAAIGSAVAGTGGMVGGGGIGSYIGFIGGSMLGGRLGAPLGAPEKTRDKARFGATVGGVLGPLGAAIGAGVGAYEERAPKPELEPEPEPEPDIEMGRASNSRKRGRKRNVAEITHVPDPDTGALIQIVSPRRLREILDADGDNYDRPSDWGPDDEWDVER